MNSKTHSTLIISVLVLATIAIALIVGFLIAGNRAESPAPNQDQNPAVQNPFHPEISVSNLQTGQTIQLPFTVMGQVKGNWFFEGSFPVFMKNASGAQIGVGLASSTQDWMTPNVIPFSVTLPAVNYQGPGFLVFTKDNPSGEPQFDDSYTLPVIFQ